MSVQKESIFRKLVSYRSRATGAVSCRSDPRAKRSAGGRTVQDQVQRNEIRCEYRICRSARADLQRFKRDMESSRRPAAEKSILSSGARMSAAQKKSVAVLYFETQSGAKEDEYTRDGITEDIVTELSEVARIEIFPRSEMLGNRAGRRACAYLAGWHARPSETTYGRGRTAPAIPP